MVEWEQFEPKEKADFLRVASELCGEMGSCAVTCFDRSHVEGKPRASVVLGLWSTQKPDPESEAAGPFIREAPVYNCSRVSQVR